MKNIFVGNLSFGATEDAVRSLFETHGSVERVSIVTDRDSGQPRGFAFVRLGSQDEADRSRQELDGRIVGKFGTAGKLIKEFGSVHEMDCRNANEVYVGEITNWRIQKLSLHPNQSK